MSEGNGLPPFRVLPAGRALQALGANPDAVRSPSPGELSAPSGGEIVYQHQPGTDVVSGLVHPALQIMQWGWRALPEESMFSNFVTPGTPMQFQLGSFAVPRNTELWLFEFETNIYRFSGIDPMDWIRAEIGRYNGMMGFDFDVNGRRPGNVKWELDPHAITGQKQSFDVPIGTGPANLAQFNRAAVNSFAATSGQGTALFPPGRMRLGPSNGPFCYVCQETSHVSLSCVIWRPLTSPIACIEGVVMGYLVDRLTSQRIQMEVSPR